jgi:membrane protein implicated in regulation of membrane protease activity
VLALTGAEWGVLVVAIGPAVLAVAVVWLVWRWSKRYDDDQGSGEGS